MFNQVKIRAKQSPAVKKLGNYTALGTATMLPALAMANLTQPDTSKIVEYIGFATVAVVAIGTAKLIPAAAMWLYSALGGMVKRG